MISSMFSSMLNPIMRAMISGGGITPPPLAGITKTFVDTLVPGLSQYYILDTPIALTGNWTIKHKCSLSTTATEFVCRFTAGSNDHRILTSGRSSFRIVGDTNAHLQGTNTIDFKRRKLHQLEFGVRNYVDQLSPGVMFMIVDGIESTLNTPINPDALSITTWGANGVTASAECILSDLEITAGGNVYSFNLDGSIEVSALGRTLTPTNIPAGQISTFTLDDDGDWAQAELLLDNSFDNPADWSTDSGAVVTGGQAVWDGTQVAARDIYQTPTIVEGRQHKGTMVIDEISAGELGFKIGGTAVPASDTFNTTGEHSYIANAGSGGRVGLQGSIPTIAKAGSCSVMPFIELSDLVPGFILRYKMNGNDSSLIPIMSPTIVAGLDLPDLLATEFNGVDQYYDADADSALIATIGSGTFTIVFRIKTSIESARTIIEFGDPDLSTGFKVNTRGVGGLTFKTSGDSHNLVDERFFDDIWLHVAITSTGSSGTMEFFVDSIANSTTRALPPYNFTDTNHFMIADTNLPAILDDIRVYDLVLSQEQITELYNNKV